MVVMRQGSLLEAKSSSVTKFTLQDQFQKLHELRGMSLHKLLRLHDNTFTGTKWAAHIPKWQHRKVYEQRLWFLWSVHHYHLPPTDRRAVAFRVKAKKILSQQFVDGFATKEQIAQQQVLEHERFTVKACQEGPIEWIDGCLLALEIHIEGTEQQRRRCLWEYFHLPSSKLPIKRHRYSKIPVKASVAALVRLHPDMGFEEFQDRFHALLPTVTCRRFTDARYEMRKLGYAIPKLKTGRKVLRSPDVK